MATKVKEIVSNPHGDASQCTMCTPGRDRVPHDKVWRFSRATREQGLKATTKV